MRCHDRLMTLAALGIMVVTPSIASAAPYGAQYEPDSSDPLLRGPLFRVWPNKALSFTVRVTNTGTLTWTSGGATPFQLRGSFWQGNTELNPGSPDFPLPKNVAPSESVTVTVTNLTAPSAEGTYTLKWDMVRLNVTRFSTQGVPTKDQTVIVVGALAAEYDNAFFDPTGRPITPGHRVTTSVTVTNIGTQPWVISPVGQSYRLSYHWLTADRRPLGPVTEFFKLPGNVEARGGTVRDLKVQVQAPSAPGDYILRWDMVQVFEISPTPTFVPSFVPTIFFNPQGTPTSDVPVTVSDCVCVACCGIVATPPPFPELLNTFGPVTPGVEILLGGKNLGTYPGQVTARLRVPGGQTRDVPIPVDERLFLGWKDNGIRVVIPHDLRGFLDGYIGWKVITKNGQESNLLVRDNFEAARESGNLTGGDLKFLDTSISCDYSADETVCGPSPPPATFLGYHAVDGLFEFWTTGRDRYEIRGLTNNCVFERIGKLERRGSVTLADFVPGQDSARVVVQWSLGYLEEISYDLFAMVTGPRGVSCVR